MIVAKGIASLYRQLRRLHNERSRFLDLQSFRRGQFAFIVYVLSDIRGREAARQVVLEYMPRDPLLIYYQERIDQFEEDIAMLEGQIEMIELVMHNCNGAKKGKDTDNDDAGDAGDSYDDFEITNITEV